MNSSGVCYKDQALKVAVDLFLLEHDMEVMIFDQDSWYFQAGELMDHSLQGLLCRERCK